MRYSPFLVLAVFCAVSLSSPGHTGVPPSLPEFSEIAPTTVAASATALDNVGTSFCAYGTAFSLTCQKNGTNVTLTFNSITQNSPHANHMDNTWNVDLTPLNLVPGDVLSWTAKCWATSGLHQS